MFDCPLRQSNIGCQTFGRQPNLREPFHTVESLRAQQNLSATLLGTFPQPFQDPVPHLGTCRYYNAKNSLKM